MRFNSAFELGIEQNNTEKKKREKEKERPGELRNAGCSYLEEKVTPPQTLILSEMVPWTFI
jgi:hypothetical protein